MFPDDPTAKSFQCGERKAAYLTVFGLAPHFTSLLAQKAKSHESGFVLLFDESLNNMTKNKQMDLHKRFWEHDEVATRYLDSQFMGHGTADHLLETFNKSMTELG